MISNINPLIKGTFVYTMNPNESFQILGGMEFENNFFGRF